MDEFDKKLEINLHEESILLVEGIFLYRNELKKYYDYNILLQITQEEQLKRATQSDFTKNGSGASKFIGEALKFYFENNK